MKITIDQLLDFGALAITVLRRARNLGGSNEMKDSIEQVLHFVFLGVLGGVLFGPLAIAIPQIRELSRWKLPWPMKGQWPPGKPFDALTPDGKFTRATSMDRVEDMRWDLVFTLTGAMLGQSIQIGLLVWWLI